MLLLLLIILTELRLMEADWMIALGAQEASIENIRRRVQML